MLGKLEDDRLVTFGHNLIFNEAPEILPQDIYKKIKRKIASRILIQQLVLICDDKMKFDDFENKDEPVVDENVLQMRKLLKTPIEDLTLSVRAYNCLRSAKIELLGDLVKYNTTDLLKFRNFGRKSLVEIEALLTEKGLSFGMDLAPYKLIDEQ